eukprot:CAMPEP_0182421128 /NCGR_PEP_ID=MMETSP1167-20130531/6366_1 /TAXON_ID=2988 /ORGANISM="Mallomonas Sp, Strain CCMP3275" /LENGTH=243 /DNA_ID=CAMNT_0024597951 /DNA_START=63 /DNA_END=790 /DNA_ORIENTATION=+
MIVSVLGFYPRTLLHSNYHAKYVMRMVDSSESDANSKNNVNESPQIIPFDDMSEFSRDSFKENMNKVKKASENTDGNPIIDINLGVWRNENFSSSSKNKTNFERPTGYSNDDDDDWIPSRIDEDDTPEMIKFISNAFISSPYDTKSQSQAKQIVRSITLLSFLIGLVFTIAWYAFPGNFIHYKANTQFSSRYATQLVDPEELLTTEFTESGGVFFDDGEPPMAKTTVSVAPSSPSSSSSSSSS